MPCLETPLLARLTTNTTLCLTIGSARSLGSTPAAIFGGVSATPTYLTYPREHAKFSDEGGKASDGNAVYFIRNDDGTENQFDFFVPDEAQGLTQAGLSHLNQSIEAFVYCVLGSQVNVRSSILGDRGRAKEAQSEFLVLMEDAIRQPDLSKCVQRYQLAVDEAKVRLDFVACPGTWLTPSPMVINTASTVGYNNQLMQATTNMKLGVNNNVNTETKKVGLRLMDSRPSKVNVPNSHQSNPIHKEVMKAKGMGGRKKEVPKKQSDSETEQADPAPNKGAGTKHDANKIMTVVAAIGVAGLLVFSFHENRKNFSGFSGYVL